MAEFSSHGIDDLLLDMQQIEEIPENVQDEMLNAMADVTAREQQKKALAYGVQDTGITIRSIKKGKVKLRKGVRVIYITPTGTRKRGRNRVRNAEIAFVNEFGTDGQKARPFVRDGNAASAEQATQAATDVHERWLRSKNL